MRHAILLVNNVLRSSRRKLITNRGRDYLISDLEAWLGAEELGPDRFAVHPIADATTTEAFEQINRALEDVSEEDEVLFYYFGHGCRPQNRLHFFCKGSRPDRRNSMLSFRNVLEQISGANVGKCYFVLDCCYSGASELDFTIEEISPSSYYLMASAIGRAKAIAHGVSESELAGAFTQALIDTTRSRKAIDRRQRIVTFSSLFEAASEELQRRFPFQLPVSRGDLGAQSFWRSPATLPPIEEEPKHDLPRTSYYRKILRLATYLEDAIYPTIRELYNHARSLQHEEFLTEQQTDDEPGEFVHMGTFEKYVRLLRRLEIVKEGELITLADDGRRLVAEDCSHFNSRLCKLVTKTLEAHGVTLPGLERDIVSILDGLRIPNMEEIHHRNIRRTTLPKWQFKILVDLLALTGALKWSSRRTYFPP